jgi:hypothetical protein
VLRQILALPFAVSLIATAQAAPIVQRIETQSIIEQVADGCGSGRYRGPGGACHRYGSGPYPDGYYGPHFWNWAPHGGCPRGYWRGPWGHCRNTPYHGRLPGGGWKP